MKFVIICVGNVCRPAVQLATWHPLRWHQFGPAGTFDEAGAYINKVRP